MDRQPAAGGTACSAGVQPLGQGRLCAGGSIFTVLQELRSCGVMTVGRPSPLGSLSNDCLAAILALVPLQER